jgi:hypothetical protein
MRGPAVVAAAVSMMAEASVHASAAATVPRWVPAANRVALTRVFGGARPVETHYLFYRHTIAVVFVFMRPAVCGACSAPSSAMLPRGRVVRLSYDRKTHAITGAYRFCEVRGGSPPLADCLRR